MVTSHTLVAGGAGTAATTVAEVHVGSSAIATGRADFLKLLPPVAVSSRCCCCLLLSSRCSCCSWDVVSSALHHFNNTKVCGRKQERLYALNCWATGSMDTINAAKIIVDRPATRRRALLAVSGRVARVVYFISKIPCLKFDS